MVRSVAERLDERGLVALLLTRGNEDGSLCPTLMSRRLASLSHRTRDAVVEVEIGTPMSHNHAAWVCLARLKRIVNELLRKENHAVETTIEESSAKLAQPALRGDNGLVMPYDDGLAEETEGTKEHHEFQSLVMRGIHGVILLTAGEHTPRRTNGGGYTGERLLRRTVPDYADAVVLEVAGTIEEVRGKLAVLHSVKTILDVLRVVEVDVH